MHRVMQFCSDTTQSLFRDLTFKRKLMFTYLLISVIPVLIVGIVSFSVSNKMIIDMKSEMVEKEFANYAEKISSILQDVESVSISLFSNEYLQDSLSVGSGIDDIKKSEFYNSIGAVSTGILNNKKYISLINVFGKNGLQYKSQAYTTDLFYDYKSFREYMSKNNITGINKWYGTEIFNIFNSKRHNIMNIKIIRDINTLDELGILVFSVDEIYLRNIYGNNNYQSLICDGSGKIISHVQDTEINRNISDTEYFKKIVSSGNDTGSFLYDVKGKKTLVSYSKVRGLGWYIVNLLDYGTILKESSKIGNITLLIIIVCFQISIFMALLISRNLTKPIINLKSLMAQVEEGNLDVHFNKEIMMK
ncbi:MAG TPA: hypothetical protein GXX20_10840 [Clostridiaceae bacterium]|nr:hypothetical protein [Clostridiaceae bacterium]